MRFIDGGSREESLSPDFDSMTEADVREIVVRPLLHRLGYAHGTQANIRTEVPLRYGNAFLGRKNPKKDPPLAGRADYICDATSYGRWTVEVKSPRQPISQDDVEQAHTYSAHPEIAAAYFLVTNGRDFQLFATGKLEKPLLEWPYEDTEQQLMTIFNIVGYNAIRKLTAAITPDINKPLGAGLPSNAKIIGGEVAYGEHKSDHPLLQNDVMKGLIGTITGKSVERAADGRLHAIVSVRSPYQQLAELNKLAGLDEFHFFSSDEYISDSIERPTIFQNVAEGHVDPGVKVKIYPTLPEMAMPIGFTFIVYTDATGYVNGDVFEGVLSFQYDYRFIRGRPTGIRQIDSIFSSVPPTAQIMADGRFRVLIGR